MDGASFAAQAVEKGAKLVVSHCKIDGLPILVVEKINLALAKLTWAFYGIDELQKTGN